jgi:MSHA biogenesis protein MshI
MGVTFFTRSKKEQGWLVIDATAETLRFVHGHAEPGKRAAVDIWTTADADSSAAGLERVAKSQHFDRYQCATLLRAGEYQLLQVEAPPVPAAELKSAIRWRLKDLLDYHLDDATIDVLDVPAESGTSARGHAMFAVAAKNDVIESRIKSFEEARIPLEVIDIPETAQRNIAALYEGEARGIALLYVDRASSLLTVNYRSELYLARRLEVGLDQILKYSEGDRDEVFGRIQLELQRTLDHFDRQYSFVPVAKLLIAPTPEETGLAAFLGANLGLPVEKADLGAKLDVVGNFDAAAQWQFFHLVGAALRVEARAL